MTAPRHAPLRRSALLLALVLLLGPAPIALAQSAASQSQDLETTSGTPSESSARPGRATATAAIAARASVAPVLDGRTNDAAWANAQVIDQFLQYEPNEGQESRFRTEARVTFDDRYLYVLARVYDPAPD